MVNKIFDKLSKFFYYKYIFLMNPFRNKLFVVMPWQNENKVIVIINYNFIIYISIYNL